MNKITITASCCMLALAATCALAQTEPGQLKTSSGQPRLQGHWTSSTVVPFERPQELGEQAFYSQAEAQERLQRSLQTTETEFGTAADVHYQFEDYGLSRSQNQIVQNLSTSILVDPPDGRLPETTERAQRIAAGNNAWRREHGFDSAQDRPLGERCIIWSSEGPPMLPLGYNSNLQIMQSENHVVILMEMIHDARIIPLDRDAPISGPPQWLGNSRGWWEENTLVVETSGFSGRAPARGINAPMSQDALVTERFTRMDAETLLYEFSVSDPTVWEQPWSGRYPMTSIDGPMFEYACHEGNYGLPNNLSGARATEQDRD